MREPCPVNDGMEDGTEAIAMKADLRVLQFALVATITACLCGNIRGNLCVGFRTGIFIKAHSAPYQIEHNTVDGRGHGLGFGSTRWSPGQRFARNIIFDCARELDHLPPLRDGEVRSIDFNCYWSPSRVDVKPIGAHDLVADPLFVNAANRDFRLEPNSPNIGAGKNGTTIGATPER